MTLKKFFWIVGLDFLGAAYFACNAANAEPSANKEVAAPAEFLSRFIDAGEVKAR